MSLGPRHRAREVALQILYRFDVEATQALESHRLENPRSPIVPKAPPKAAPVAPKPASLPAHVTAQELTKHFDHFKISDDLRPFAAELVAGSLTEMDRVDELLERQASNWKLARMSVVDRSLLRLSVAEMIRFPDTSASVIIDEAVELAKQFGNAESPAFVNGILDAVRKQLRPSG